MRSASVKTFLWTAGLIIGSAVLALAAIGMGRFSMSIPQTLATLFPGSFPKIEVTQTMDFDVISQGPQLINHCVKALDACGVPMVTPGGGLGAHINAREVVDHIPSEQYPAGSLVAALYLCGGIRGMERGTLSEERNPDGTERIASAEMVRLAFPRRVFTLSQTEYVIDRVKWLYDHRHLIGGLRFVHEPKTLRFFTGRLEPVSDWPEKLVEAYIADFGEDQ